MTKARKLVALMLAFLMIFSSVSVLASAMNSTVDSGTALNISTKFFKEVDGVWTETTKVQPDDTVKARVYLGTDYYSGDSTLLFFYDKDFFTHEYADGQDLSMNPAVADGMTGYFVTNANLQSQVDAGYITADQLNDYGVFVANVAIKDGATAKFDDSDWLFEFELKVASDASGEGDLFTVEEFYQSTSRKKALGDVPKGVEGGVGAEAWSMWVWDAAFNLESQPVSTISSITFNANGGAFADGTDSFGPIEGTIEEAIPADKLPATPVYEGYTFLGWVDAEIAEPTEDDVIATPSQYPMDDLVLNAYWVKNVNITFADTGDTPIEAITNVTPGTPFKEIANPTKAGYTFVGWDVRGNMDLPDTYPAVDTTYTAIWAINVEVSFETNGADPIAPVPGYEGDVFDAEIAKPEKEGHYFVGWLLQGQESLGLVELPEVFPATDVTYEAVYDTYTYYVTYIVKNEKTGETSTYYLQAEYDSVVKFPRVNVPEGYEMDSQWYTDADCTVPFAAGTKMGNGPITLYTTIDVKTYKAYFMLNEGDDIADAYKVVDVVYGEQIAVPEDPSKSGYTFAGWDTFPSIMDKEEDVYFYATWEEKVGNVVYKVNDGSDETYEVYDIPYGYDIEIPGDPMREGYTFLGWNTDAAATDPLAIDGTKMPELADGETLTYYAVWQVNKYMVTFDSNEGSAVEDKEQAYNSEVTAPAEPTRAGYKFLGWKNADNETVSFPFTMPAYDVALTAEWKQEVYTIRYADTGDVTIAEKTVSMGDTIEIPTDLKKDGQGVYFTGWDETPPTAIGDMGNDGEVFTYTALWTAESYTIIYKDTGDTTIENKIVKMGDTIEVPTGLKKVGQGLYFTGWDETPPTAIGDMGNNGDEFTYTALWDKESYTLQFANTGDTVIDEKTVTYGDTIAATADPEKKGYVFAGWDVTPPTAIGDLGENGDVIVYTASWTAKTYTFRFTNTGGTTVEDATVTFGQAYTAPTGLTKTGYNFLGWEDKDGNAPPATIPDMGDDKAVIEYAGQWEAKKINVTFNGNTGLIGTEEEVQVESTFDDAIVLPSAEMNKAGYAFVGWSTDPDAETGSMTLGNLTTETPATYYAIWSASSANYKVEFYYMNVDGTDYVKAEEETETLPGVVDQPVATYIPGTVTGFAYNAAISTVDGTVPAEGTLVLKVYYDRQKFALTYEGNEAVQVFFEAAIPAAVTTPVKEGHYFNGWVDVPEKMPAGAVSIAADWAKESYVFKFADTGDMSVDSETVTYGDTFKAPTDLTKTGYVFTGFDPEVPTNIKDMGDNGDEFTFTAQWREKVYTFTFTNLYGNVVEDATVKYGDDYSAPTGLVREGWNFTGWENVDTFEAPPSKIEDMGVDGTTFTYTAKWTKQNFTITYDADGGEFSGQTTVTRPFEAQIAEPSVPVKTGYDFSHWINTEDDSTVVFPFIMPAENLNLKAVYTPKTYVFKFVDTGDVTIGEKTVTFGDDFTVPTDLTKDGQGVYFTGFEPVVPTKIEDMGATGTVFTYTAQWTNESYTLTFADTGDTAVENMTVTFGQNITVPSGLTKEGKGVYFTGFAPELTATIGDLGNNGETVTYTAQWANESYTLTFTNLFGNTVADMPVTYGDTITVPTGLTRYGYEFAGWDPELSANIGDLGANGETLSYKAQWTAKVIGVTFDGNEGTIEGNATKVVDTAFDSVIVAPVADRAGYTFVGWSTDKNAETGNVNLGNLTTETPATYYAIWSADAKTYTVEFYEMNLNGEHVKLDKTVTLNGTVGKETATYNPEAVVGFTVNETKSVLKGTVPAEGELVLKVYYDRQKFALTYEGNEAVEVYFGTAAADMPKAAKEPTKEGHVFASWAALPATMPATAVNVAANWDKETYNLVFADTNDAGDAITGTVIFGDAITAPTGLTKTGHVFAGWSPEVPAAAGDFGANGATVTYTAQWTKETYTLTFTDLYGNTVADMPVTYGDTIIVPAGLTRTGYEFAGWLPELTETIGDLGADKAKVSYAAQWTAKVIGVTFDGNNGTIEGAATKVVPTTFDQAIVAPVASRAGYTFVGWSTDKNAEVGSNNLGKLTTETPATYYAIWSADGANYTVEFWEMNLDGETYTKVGEDTTLTGIVDDTVEYTPAAKTGFAVNNEMSELEGTIPAEGTLVLKVYYDRQSYVLSYMGAGAEHKAFNVLYGTPVAQWPVPDSDPVRTGYYFTKWAESGKTEMPAEKVTITSEWAKETYTITFDTVGGTPVGDITAKYGEGIIIPDDPTKAGHEFAGWSDVIPGEMPDYGDNGEVITITASWTAETYTLKFADTDDNGTVITKEVTFGDTIEVPSGLVKTGYVFDKWDVTPPTEIGDLGENEAEITYTALWTKETYTLKFADTDDNGTVITKVVSFGDDFAAPAGLTKTGHVFDKWDVTPPTKIEDMGANGAEFTYTAQWTKETYIFHFTNTGANAIEDATVTFGDAYTAPTDLTKTGYNFIGWKDEDGNAPPATITDLGENGAEFTYAAQWEAKLINVTFDGNNGKVDGEATKVVPTAFDSDIVAPAAARDGYAFVGWSTDKNATVGTTDLGKLTTETPATYYAIWSANAVNYKVEFYYMDTEGAGYEQAENETLTLPGVVDQAVPTYVPAEVTGFTYNAEESIVDGVVPADGTTLVLEVYYDRNTYALTYEGNEAVDVYFGAALPEAVKTPENVGHYFNGWVGVPEKMPAGAVSIAADWKAEGYTLTFTDLYGNVVDDMTVTYGDEITVPAGLVREGYVFDGWSPELTETIGDLGNNGDKVAFAAQWKLDQFTITIKLDGGNIDGETADVVITQDYLTDVEFSDEPVKEGYTFVDWSIPVPSTMPAEDMTITALWQINTYTITFNTDGGSDVAAITGPFGTAITAPAAPTKEGHVFAGWSEEIPETMPDYGANGAAHEIKATWTKETYTLKFANTGDTAIADKPVTYGDTIEAITGLTKVGHVFDGWDVTPPTTIGDLGENGAVVTYTAKWTPETYTLKFANTGDTAIDDKVVTYGDTIEAITGLTKEGHTFAGWDVTPPTEIGDLGENGAVITYTAAWDKITYTVKWIDENGTKTTQVVYGDAIVAPEADGKEGYYFVMWTPAIPATMPADENLEFTALYEVSVYNVNFYVNGKFRTGYTAEFGEVIRTDKIGYVRPTGYVFDGWYTDAECTTKLAEGATVGATVVNLYAKETVGSYAANFWLDDGMTDLYDTRNVQFDKQINAPEEPSKEGYEFAGWDPFVGLMDAEGKDFVAQWNENVVTVTFYADLDNDGVAEEYETIDGLVYGEEMEVPGDPYKKGYRFDGWAVKGTTEIVDLEGTTVPAADAEYEAIFTVTELYVTYFNYAASEFGPDGDPAPEYEAYAIDGAAVVGTYNVGDAIAHPANPVVVVVKADGVEHTEYYTFSHWEDADGNVWADGAEMPAEDVALYAKYERVSVHLAVKAGTTGVIEKAHATDREQWYVYGFTGRRINAAEFPKFFEVVGDGSYTIDNSELSGMFGTGAKVHVVDNVTGEEVETFYIIIFGDLDGNALVNVNDATILNKEMVKATWSSRRGGTPYRIKAADLARDRIINVNDATLLNQAANSLKKINQQTGVAS